MIPANCTNRLIALLLVVVLIGLVAWGVTNLGLVRVQAGGGQTPMNQIFQTLILQEKQTVTIQAASPVSGVSTFVVTADGTNNTYAFARNGADHLCVKAVSATQTPTICIPFTNIASFSW